MPGGHLEAPEPFTFRVVHLNVRAMVDCFSRRVFPQYYVSELVVGVLL